MTALVQPPSTDTTTWHVVIECRGIHYLYLMRMYAHLPTSVVMARTLEMYHRKQPWWSHWLCQPAVEIATILRVCQYGVKSLGWNTLGVSRHD